MLGEPRHIAAHHAGIHTELRLHELRAGVDLGLQAGRSPAGRRIDRIVGAAEEKIGASGDLATGRQFAGVAKPPRGIEQRTRIEIKHRHGIRLVTGARIVTAQHQQIAHARGCRAQQVALQRDTIAITAGELKNRFDALLHEHGGGSNGAEMGPCAGTVGDIDGIGKALAVEALWPTVRHGRPTPAASLPR